MALWFVGAFLVGAIGSAEARLVPTGPEELLPDPPDSCGHMGPDLATLADGSVLTGWSHLSIETAFRSQHPDGSLSDQWTAPVDAFSRELAPAPGGALLATAGSRVEVRRVDPGSQSVGEPSELASGGFFGGVGVVGDAAGNAVIWSESFYSSSKRSRVYHQRLDASLAPLGDTFRAVGQVLGVVLLSDGTSVLAYDRNEYVQRDVALLRFDAFGQPLEEIAIGATGGAVAARGQKVVVAWTTGGEAWMQLFDGDPLEPLDTPRRIDDGTAEGRVRLLAHGGGWVALWVSPSGAIRGRVLTDDGTALGPSLRLHEPIDETVHPNADLGPFDAALDGDRLVVVWQVRKIRGVFPVASECEYGHRLFRREFRVEGLHAPEEIPLLGPVGLVAAILALASAGRRRIVGSARIAPSDPC